MKRRDMTDANSPRPSGRSRVLHMSMALDLARGPKPHEAKRENKLERIATSEDVCELESVVDAIQARESRHE